MCELCTVMKSDLLKYNILATFLTACQKEVILKRQESSDQWLLVILLSGIISSPTANLHMAFCPKEIPSTAICKTPYKEQKIS